MRTKLFMLLAAVAALALLLCLPVIYLALLVVNFLVHLAVLGFQVVTARLPHATVPRRSRLREEPFVSIHVPAYNEPPEVLKETLYSLSKLQWRNYEVLVIDNNTADESVWRPVQEYCRQLGPHFRFLHVEGLQGAKAGALNWVRPRMNPRTEYIFVVDADYVVEPGALRRGLSYFTEPDIGLVQFPQDYRNISVANKGMALDFKHFFAGYMNMANRLNCVPSTGTLSLFRVAALRAVNGFDTRIVTEDADLGFRLNLRGYRSVYADDVIGRGLMPHDLESLKKQRWRWAFGNAQILKLNWRLLLFGRELTLKQKLGYVAHLTAWFSFELIPSLTLIVLAPLAWLGLMDPLHPYLVVLAGLTLTTSLLLRFGTLYYSLRHEGHSLREICLAFLTHVGLGWIFSASWIKCLFDHHSPFVRTNKFLTARMPGILRTTLVETLLGVSLMVTCLLLGVTGFVIGPVAALVVGLGRLLIYWVWWQTRATRRLTAELSARTREARSLRRKRRLEKGHPLTGMRSASADG